MCVCECIYIYTYFYTAYRTPYLPIYLQYIFQGFAQRSLPGWWSHQFLDFRSLLWPASCLKARVYGLIVMWCYFWKPEATLFLVFLPGQNMLPAQFFFRTLWAPTITRDSWGQWPVSEFGSRTPNTKLMVRRRPICFRHIGGNYRTSSAHRARSLPSCSLRSIVLPENPCARSRFSEKCAVFVF